MRDPLKRICELQVHYSAENTSEMQARGNALRRDLKPAIEGYFPSIAPALGEFGNDILADASDGIGRKTELPWVRFCSKRMSPNPTEGFYSVIHFSTDGSAVHLTVGCGSSRFHKGSSVVLPDEDLDRQTSWARRVIVERFSTLDPFSDLPDFGARRRLPLSFQRATVVSKRVPYNDIDTFDFERFLVLAAGRLRAVYDAQATGRDIDEADQVEAEVSTAINPTRFVGLRQGIGLPAAAKRAVERRAMELAEAWLVREGYTVIDCSARQPFDFQAVKGEDRIKVEVKGTTSDFASAVLMTRAEVDLHRAERGSTALIIASRIKLAEDGGSYTADGGEVDAMVGWNISDWELEPTSYRVTRPTR